jgi:hypothetical protein
VKSLARIALRAVVLGIPMVIAACYGTAVRFSRSGKVADQDTHDPLSDIKVSCMDKGGLETDSVVSVQGNWSLNDPCDHLDAADTLSPARYQKASVPFPTADGTTISLKKVQ